MSNFEKELRSLLNRYSKENTSNTPDWILERFLSGCLASFNTAVQQREKWYGRNPTPTMITNDKDKGNTLLVACKDLASIFPEKSMSEMDAADFTDRANRIWVAAQSAKIAIEKAEKA